MFHLSSCWRTKIYSPGYTLHLKCCSEVNLWISDLDSSTPYCPETDEEQLKVEVMKNFASGIRWKLPCFTCKVSHRAKVIPDVFQQGVPWATVENVALSPVFRSYEAPGSSQVVPVAHEAFFNNISLPKDLSRRACSGHTMLWNLKRGLCTNSSQYLKSWFWVV